MTANAPDLQLVGTAQLRWGGFCAELPDAAAGYLLAVLGTRGDWVEREELAALFWPQASAEDAQRNLRVNLNRLRDRLANWGVADALASERRRLRWLPGSDLSRARAARSAGSAADWHALSALAGGHFAQGLSFRGFPVLAEWAQGERRTLIALAREAVLRCAATATPAQTAHSAGRHLQAEPGDEDVLRVHLQALAALGRHEEVAHEFAAFDTRLRADVGLPASAALAQWAQQLGPGGLGSGAHASPQTEDHTLIARDDELAHARKLLGSARLLTLQGLGGVGKTRLARALVLAVEPSPQADLQADTGAVLWLALADAFSVDELPHRVLRALRPNDAPARDTAAQAGDLLRGVRLLVLDNLEQLLHQRLALHTLLSQWLQAAPALRLLVTSREALAHGNEVLLPLRALAVASPGSETLAAPAVRLLVAAARIARPGFDARPHAATLAAIAAHVGGLPLALQLAAQWLRVLAPADVLAALQRSVGALDTPSTGLAATLGRSWQLLDAPAQHALAALSVFVSPFTAAEAIGAGAAGLTDLARLSEQGLIEQADTPSADSSGPSRLHLHPLVRAYAAERLAGQPAAARAAQERHALAVQRRLAVWLPWRQVDQRAALQAITTLLPDVLAAWQWALAQGRASFIAQAAPVLLNYYEKQGRWAEGMALFERAEPVFDAAVTTELGAIAAVQRGRALLLYRDGRFDAAEALATRALAAARQLGHGEGIKGNLNTLALARWLQGDLDGAEAAASEARNLAVSEGDHASEAIFAGTLALLHKKRGRYADAEVGWRRALAVHREVGNWSSACVTLNNLGNLLRVMGQPDDAVALLDESLRLCDAYGFVSSRPFTLINLAQAHLAAGRPEAAQPLALQALTEVRRAGERMLEAGTLLILAEMAVRAGQLAAAADHLAPALRLARALNDPANLLEALCGYARWCLAGGQAAEAARAVATVRAHPALHAELLDELQGSALAALAADPAAVPVDLLVLVEQASAALTGP